MYNGGRKLNRIQPALGAEHMKTYSIQAPVETHWRRGTCAEVQCEQQERGWKMLIDPSVKLGRDQYDYLKHHSGRHFTESKVEGGMVELIFPPGQTCFREHKVRLDREERYVVKGGDFRGNPRGIPTRVHTKPELWVEDFQTNQEAIKEAQRKG